MQFESDSSTSLCRRKCRWVRAGGIDEGVVQRDLLAAQTARNAGKILDAIRAADDIDRFRFLNGLSCIPDLDLGQFPISIAQYAGRRIENASTLGARLGGPAA